MKVFVVRNWFFTVGCGLVRDLNKIRHFNSLVGGHEQVHDVLDAPQFILDAQLLVLVAAHDVPALGVRLGGAEKFFNSLSGFSIGHSTFTDGEVYNN